MDGLPIKQSYFCPNCNTFITREFSYCTNCGVKLTIDSLITLLPSNFCSRCIDETLFESTGNLNMYNFFGTTLIDMGYKCKICNSYVAKKCFVFAGIPVVSFGNYRILQKGKSNIFVSKTTEFIARKVRDQKKYRL